MYSDILGYNKVIDMRNNKLITANSYTEKYKGLIKCVYCNADMVYAKSNICYFKHKYEALNCPLFLDTCDILTPAKKTLVHIYDIDEITEYKDFIYILRINDTYDNIIKKILFISSNKYIFYKLDKKVNILNDVKFLYIDIGVCLLHFIAVSNKEDVLICKEIQYKDFIIEYYTDKKSYCGFSRIPSDNSDCNVI